MAGRWRYVVTDLTRLGEPVRDHLPIRCDSFDDGLGLDDTMTLVGSLPLEGDPDPEDALLEQRRVIWPIRDGQVHGAYVVAAHAPFGPRSRSIQFRAERIDTVLGRREIESTLVFRQVDQLVIARALIAYALGRTPVGVAPEYAAMIQRLPGADVPWLRLDDSESGVPRDRDDNDDGYQGARHPNVADMLSNLAELENGFDYRLGYGLDPVSALPFAQVQLRHPGFASGPVIGLEYPGTVLDWSVATDTGDTETYSRIYGPAEGAEKVLVTGAAAVDRTALSQGWPLLMGSASSTASQQSTLDAAGRSRLASLAGPNRGWTLVVRGSVLGTYELGDVAALTVRHKRWPAGRRVWVQIVGHKVEPARQGRAERVTLSVVEVAEV